MNLPLPTPTAPPLQPALETPRLVLRPFAPADAEALQGLASRREIADTMISIPHPYPEGEAARSIARFGPEFTARRAAHFAVTLRSGGGLIGAIALRDFDWEHAQAELSLWIAPEQQGRGFAGEAVQAVVDYGFGTLGLNRIYAHHMTRNPACGRVLARAGFQREGLLRQRVRKWGVFEDVVLLAALRGVWAGPAAKPVG